MKSPTLNQLLKGYGLTINQTKVLSVLTQNKTYLTVNQISQLSNLARESIYHILLQLKEKGLIEKIISTPKKYCAIPLKISLQMLHKQKINNIKKLEALTKQALIEYNNSNSNQIKKRSQYVLVPKKDQFLKKINQAIYNSKKIVKIKTSYKRYLQAIKKHEKIYQKAFTKALSNGAKIQVIITMKPTEEKILKNIEFFHKSPNVSIKFDNNPTKLVIAVIDDNELFLINEPNSNLEESSVLWSNNQSLILALSNCFDTFWKNLTPCFTKNSVLEKSVMTGF